jgi:hypothetical protein
MSGQTPDFPATHAAVATVAPFPHKASVVRSPGSDKEIFDFQLPTADCSTIGRSFSFNESLTRRILKSNLTRPDCRRIVIGSKT